MEFLILGPLEVVDGDRPIALGGDRQRAILALLLTRPNEVVSTDRLADELWGASPPKRALNTIQYYVSQLRKALGADRIVTRPPGYLIRVDPDELDLARFERLADEGSAQSLHEALALWRGPALADLAYESFAREEAACRRGPRTRPQRRGGHRARAAERPAPAPRTTPRTAHARSLSLWPPG